MNKPILEVKNIGKSYKSYSSELWRILSWFGIKHKAAHETWTLQNINFSIKAGEAIGIIGQNGAGKSTLLKIITGTLKPSTGSVHVRGKIAAILELGMGFHPDLTGRQNAYHSAGLMGYSEEQINNAMADIERFADIGEYFDQPIRTYSSGMQARVSFAVAIHVDPDILIVDEALAVGDARFQKKCFDKFDQFIREGKTLFLVSHSSSDIIRLTTHAIWLEQGLIKKQGVPKHIVEEYIANTVHATIMQKPQSNSEQKVISTDEMFLTLKPIVQQATINGDGSAIIDRIGLFDTNKHLLNILHGSQKVKIIFHVIAHKKINETWIGFSFINSKGIRVLGANSFGLQSNLQPLEPNTSTYFSFEFVVPEIENGVYFISVAINDGTPERHTRECNIYDAYEFEFISMSLLQKQQAIIKIEECAVEAQ